MKMDDVPDELEVKGVIGKRLRGARHYVGEGGAFSGWALDVTYRFDLKALHEVDAAKYYTKPVEVQSSKESTP